MSGIYNSFEIKINDSTKTEQVHDVVTKTIKENNYQFEDILVWGTVEVNSTIINAEDFYGFTDKDLATSQKLFTEMCKEITQQLPELDFMGKHSFDYSSADHDDCVFCFKKNDEFTVYEGSFDEVANNLDRCVCFSVAEGNLKEKQTIIYDEKEGLLEKINDAYEKDKYPKVPKNKQKKEQKVKGLGKYKLKEGHYYRVHYKKYWKGGEKLIGKLTAYYSPNYQFELFGGKIGFIDVHDIEEREDIVELIETDESKRIIDEYNAVSSRIEDQNKKRKELGAQVYSMYLSEGENWNTRPLEKKDIGKSYPGIEKPELGKTYLVEYKENSSKRGMKEPYMIIGEAEGVFGPEMIALGCNPEGWNEIQRIKPISVWNLDEFTDELFINSEADNIQTQRMNISTEITNLNAEKARLKALYYDSLVEFQ